MRMLGHSENDAGEPQLLADHLLATARAAGRFASRWRAAEWGRLAGLLHDIGKVSEQFQRYVRGIGDRGGDHSLLGALQAPQRCLPLIFAVAGHHGSLPDLAHLKGRIGEGVEQREALVDRARSVIDLPSPADFPQLPDHVASDFAEAELFTRMLFSALVDADHLDTGRHFRPEQAAVRGVGTTIGDLWAPFAASQQRLMADAPDNDLNRIRREIYERCLTAADEPQGVFSLTVPTGGGKTRSSMGFALRHALYHDLDRVIVVIPYTSIIEQAAAVYRSIFGAEAVLEHHSSVELTQLEDTDRQRWQLAAENWDRPIVVTTAVQFFESLFSNRPSKCRKLHNVARSVVIIDEVQTLPIGLLRPSMEMLASFVRHYGATCLLMTATPPAYDTVLDEPIAEIVPDPIALAQELRRVTYAVPREGKPPRMTWPEVAGAMRQSEQAMTVVNSRRDARALFRELPEDSRVHLSTNMCPAHRREVLAQIRERLGQGVPLHLATTQLVEAGVDIDFPLVLRALAPLDRIVQAAGRCNREGRLDTGQVIIFEPADGAMPPGTYETGAHTTRVVFSDDPEVDLSSPATHRRFFELLYPLVDLDQHDIDELRERLAFEQVARKYRLIPDDTIPVAIPWEGGEELLERIEQAGTLTRDDLRDLQPYIVNMRRWEHEKAVAQRLCRRIIEGVELWRWEGGYDRDLGIVVESEDTRTVI